MYSRRQDQHSYYALKCTHSALKLTILHISCNYVFFKQIITRMVLNKNVITERTVDRTDVNERLWCQEVIEGPEY